MNPVCTKLNMNRACIFAMTAALLTAAGCSSPQAPDPAAKPAKYQNGLTASEVFNLRTKCSEIVDKLSSDYVIGVVGVALTSQVSSHYNPDMNRCYAEVVVTKNFSYDYKAHPIPDNYRTTSLYDAQTKNLTLTKMARNHTRMTSRIKPVASRITKRA